MKIGNNETPQRLGSDMSWEKVKELHAGVNSNMCTREALTWIKKSKEYIQEERTEHEDRPLQSLDA